MLSPSSYASGQSKTAAKDNVHEPSTKLREKTSTSPKYSHPVPRRGTSSVSPPRMGRAQPPMPYQPSPPAPSSGPRDHAHAHLGFRGGEALDPRPRYAHHVVSLSETALRDRYFSSASDHHQSYLPQPPGSESTSMYHPPVERATVSSSSISSSISDAGGAGPAQPHATYFPHSYPNNAPPSSMLSPESPDEYRGRLSLPQPDAYPARSARNPKETTQSYPSHQSDYTRFYENYSNVMPPSSTHHYSYPGTRSNQPGEPRTRVASHYYPHHSQAYNKYSNLQPSGYPARTPTRDPFPHRPDPGRLGGTTPDNLNAHDLITARNPPAQPSKTPPSGYVPSDLVAHPDLPTHENLPGGASRARNLAHMPMVGRDPAIAKGSLSFQFGSLIQLCDGQLKRVEELRTNDFLRCSQWYEDIKLESSKILALQASSTNDLETIIKLAMSTSDTQVTLEASHDHPFFVPQLGWSSINPELTLQHYQLPCRKLKVGDECLTLTLEAGLVRSQADTEAVKDTIEAEMMPPPPPKTSGSASGSQGTIASKEDAQGQDLEAEKKELPELGDDANTFKRPPDRTTVDESAIKRKK